MIRLAKAAKADIRGIDTWLRPKAGPAVTDRILGTIPGSIERLGQFPKMGRPGRLFDTRELIVPGIPMSWFTSWRART